jgi:hypothetical protein
VTAGRRRLVAGAAALGVVVAAALFIRPLVHGAPHPGGDNAAYVALAWSLVSGQGYTELWDPSLRPHGRYPPVYPALLAARVAAGGLTWSALKSVTVALYLLVVLATFLWARRRAGTAVAAGVALVTAMAPGMLDYGRWVRRDVPFTAFTLLALWLAERGDAAGAGPGGARDPGAAGAPPSSELDPRVWGAALALAGLAYFTRTAGLPLLVALLGVLALRRRWRALGVGGGALAVASLLWFLQGRRTGPGVPGDDYSGYLWLLDPYDPGAGLAGPADLAGRAVANLIGYLTAYLPIGMVGAGQGGARVLAVALVAVGLAGWVLRTARRPGPTELFVPLYAGLLLVWPEVWSGDRFALPLIPVLFLYAAEATGAGLRRWAPAALGGAWAALAGVVLLTQFQAYGELTRQSAACRGIVQVAGPYACFGQPMREFAEAARWASGHLPDDASVLTRKPRIWYVLSGQPSRTYPFVTDPDALLQAAGDAGAGYVVLDFVGGQGMRFLAPAIMGRPAAFCVVAGFGGEEGRPGTQLLGILTQGAAGRDAAGAGATTLQPCPPGLALPRGEESTSALPPYSASSPIPILSPAS